MLEAQELVALAVVFSVGFAACAQNAPKATVVSVEPLSPSSASEPAAPSGDAAPAAASAAPEGLAVPAKPANAIDISEATSKVEWTGIKVTGQHHGRFERFSGWIGLADGKPEGATIYVSIDVGSLKSDHEKLDGHLKTDDFFAVDQHPTATFTSTEIKAGGDMGATHTITGNLQLRGVVKSISFPATVKVDAKGVRAEAEFSMNRKDFGILYEGKKDDAIRNEVVIKLDIQGARAGK